MYKSPIEVISLDPVIDYESTYKINDALVDHAKSVAEEFDRYVISQIIKCGVKVDRDELIKALRYDRNQYEQGYKHGYEDGINYKPPVETNGDKIRQMTDEELARWISDGYDCGCCKDLFGSKPCTCSECSTVWLAWLKAEVTE